MHGNLYLVSTPIGNLEDLTFRAVKILSSVDIILAESVERTKKLLSHYDIDAKVISFNKDNEKRKAKDVIAHLQNSKNIALVSDAGTPLISDPGYKLVKECYLNNIKVTQINPGIVKTPFYNNLKISPGTKYDEFIEPNDIANIVIEVLKMRSGSVIDEINLTSQKRVINFKSK